MNYHWDEQLHLFRPERDVTFSYSDGAEVEQRLLRAMAGARDRSTFSPELSQHIQDWPSEYHLSRRRHCLLRPLQIPSGARVLELGCGCGALTRYLGDIGAELVAVEGSLMRARIAAERTRDLPNVRVVADDLLEFHTEEEFDYVLLIGVLEYASRFSDDRDPFARYLKAVTRQLTPGGKLVIAIENQLGLKYLNGCTEDHEGQRFFGIQDLYRPGTARTFGRRELTALLRSAGLSSTAFFYPFPDYKLPSVVLSDDAIADTDFNAADLISHCVARDYNGSPYRSFDEALAAEVVYRNGLLADLSNSFLVVATAPQDAKWHSAELAYSWSADRIPELCTETVFVRHDDNIEVRKQPLTTSPAAARDISLLGGIVVRHRPQRSVYVCGRQMLLALKKVRASCPELGVVVEVLRPWVEFLLQHASRTDAAGADKDNGLHCYSISGKYLDCIPSNLLETERELTPIDVEWDSAGPIPLGWVLTRGLIWSLMSGLPAEHHFEPIENIVDTTCHEHGLSVRECDIRFWLQLEAAFQSAVTGRNWSLDDLRHTSGGMRSFNDVVREVEQLRSHVATREQCIAELEQSIWQREKTIQRLQADIAACGKSLAQTHREQLQLGAELARARATRTPRLLSRLRLSSWRNRRQFQRDVQMVAKSGLFEREWYLAKNADVASSGQDPVLHYLRFGGFEGRDPGPGFSSQWYLDQNRDVRAEKMNPLVHYLRFGRKEGRKPKP